MISKEQFKIQAERFAQAQAFEKITVSYDQYHGYYHIVADKEILERLESVAHATSEAMYKDLGIEDNENDLTDEIPF